MIAHRLSQTATADRIVSLAEWRVTETGTHAEFLVADSEHAAYWHRQHAVAQGQGL